MKILILFVSVFVANLSLASEGWVILTVEQQKMVAAYKCAARAIDAAAGLVSDEIQNAGTDMPDHLYLFDLQIIDSGKICAIAFRDDTSIDVRMIIDGGECKVQSVSRFEVGF